MSRSGRTWLALAAMGALLAVVGDARSGRDDGYVVSSFLSEGMREPAAVAVFGDGALAVADYSADSVTVVEPDGTSRWSIRAGLDHPSGLCAGDALWVADTGNHRILSLDPAKGRLLREIVLAEDLRPTDVAVAQDGALWVTSPPDDVLVILDPDGGVRSTVRTLDSPRGLVADGDGMIVTEALTGRVRRLDAGGRVVAEIAGWGLGEGQFLKPKDVALLPDGDLAVLDTHQGAIQILGPTGEYQRLVSGADGPHLFEHPLGIAAFGDRIYVADAGRAEVALLTRGGKAWNGGHFPSNEVIFRPVSVLDDDPSPLCRQCHDGTKRLTAGNFDPEATNHPIDVREHADEIPPFIATNSNGTLKCTSCHQIHEQDVRHEAGNIDVVEFGFAQAQVNTLESPQVCLDCHIDYVESSPFRHRTSHQLGLPPPPEADPEVLAAARSRLDDGAVTCMSCHRPHGATAQPLLIAPVDDGTLCLLCHTRHGPGSSHHPLDMELEDAVKARVAAMDGVLGPDGKLTCLSCHDPHNATAETLLRSTGDGESACEGCHTEKADAVRDGAHAKAGCAACHGMHREPALGAGVAARGAGPQACLDCHTSGRDETPQIVVSGTHPLGGAIPGDSSLPGIAGRVACSTCHDTHGSSIGLLRMAIPDLCIECHAGNGAVIGTDHDAAAVPVGGSHQTCLSCHQVHGQYRAPRLIPVQNRTENPANARCLLCHDGSTRATEPGPAHHPTGQERRERVTTRMPATHRGAASFYDKNGAPTKDLQEGIPACPTCHDPHRWRHDAIERPGEAEGEARDSFLRDPAMVVELCANCHGSRTGAENRENFHSQEYRDRKEVW